MDSKKSFVVLMTACISPNNSINSKPGNWLKRIEIEQRLEDYKAGLWFWLNLPDSRVSGIVFADNSGFDLSILEHWVDGLGVVRSVEFLQLPECVWPDHVHYGYCELQIIDEALMNSKFLMECDYFIKATGRLGFPGVSRLLDKLEGRLKFAVDCHNYKIPLKARREGASTQLMIFSKAFYASYLTGANQKLQPWVISHIEDLLYKELCKFKGKDGAVLRWPCSVKYIGVSATTNKSYSELPIQVKNVVRSMLRTIVPNWWI